MMEAILDDSPAASVSTSAAAMPSELKLIGNYTGPFPSVAMTDVAVMEEDPIVKQRAGGTKTVGLELIHDDVGPPQLAKTCQPQPPNMIQINYVGITTKY